MHYLRHRRALRKQGGFIQGAILFALVIIAVVVAAFSLANRDSQNSADTEQARVNASYVLKVGNDIQTAVNRAIADGMAPSDVNANLLLMGATAAPALSIFDPDVKYLVRPQFPKTALQVDYQPFTSTVTARQPNWALSAITGVGGPRPLPPQPPPRGSLPRCLTRSCRRALRRCRSRRRCCAPRAGRCRPRRWCPLGSCCACWSC
jgi:hypothetical protein